MYLYYPLPVLLGFYLVKWNVIAVIDVSQSLSSPVFQAQNLVYNHNQINGSLQEWRH